MKEKIKEILKPKINLVKGTRFTSFLFLAFSILIAAGILMAANMYYDLDNNRIFTEEEFTVGSSGAVNFQVTTGGNVTIKGSTTLGDASDDTVTSNAASWTFANATTVTLADAVNALNFDSGTLSIDASNNRVGIGTTSPNYPLEVIGAIRTGGPGTSGELRIYSEQGATDYELVFKPHSNMTETSEYVWPQAKPSDQQRILASDTSGNLSWITIGEAGAGDITDVGDCASGACFTADGTGNTLYFEGTTADAYEVILTAADATGSDYTITLPAATGTVALGTGTQDYVAYWSGTNTLSAEQYLATSRGGTGADSSSWSGMVKVSSGTWSAVTGTAGYAAYWSDANTIAAEEHLSLSRGGTGAGLTATAGGIVYSTASALAISSAGTSGQLLTSGGTEAPSWKDIADIITVQNGLTESGTTTLTIELGGNLTESTTITSPSGQAFDLVINLAGTGDFRIQDNGSDTFVVTDDGKVYFKGESGYAIAETGKQILREMIPIMGFDLPVQCSTCATGCGDPSSTPLVSRIIENYPFSSKFQGTTRVHKFVVRYATNDTGLTPAFYLKVCKYDSGTSSWVEADSVDLNSTEGNTLDRGEVKVTGSVTIPDDGSDWYVTVVPNTGADTIRIYQIFLAAYDQIQ